MRKLAETVTRNKKQELSHGWQNRGYNLNQGGVEMRYRLNGTERNGSLCAEPTSAPIPLNSTDTEAN